MSKKVIAILLSLCLAALMGGCGGSGGSGAGESGSTAETSESAPAKEAMDGFDKETNQTVTVGNVTFSVPEYYQKDKDNTESKSVFGVGKEAVLLIASEDAKGKIEDFNEDVQEQIAENIIGKFNDGKITSSSAGEEINGMPAGLFEFTSTGDSGSSPGKMVTMYNENYDTAIHCIIIQADDSEYDYFPDFDKIVRSAKAEKKPKVSKDFKKTMDDYEKFFDKYVEFMKNYQESGDVMGMLSDYTEIMSQYSEMMSGLESIDTDSLSPADYAYYMEVYGRITQKLMEVSGT